MWPCLWEPAGPGPGAVAAESPEGQWLCWPLLQCHGGGRPRTAQPGAVVGPSPLPYKLDGRGRVCPKLPVHFLLKGGCCLAWVIGHAEADEGACPAELRGHHRDCPAGAQAQLCQFFNKDAPSLTDTAPRSSAHVPSEDPADQQPGLRLPPGSLRSCPLTSPPAALLLAMSLLSCSQATWLGSCLTSSKGLCSTPGPGGPTWPLWHSEHLPTVPSAQGGYCPCIYLSTTTSGERLRPSPDFVPQRPFWPLSRPCGSQGSYPPVWTQFTLFTDT